jgi:hypothetical protein
MPRTIESDKLDKTLVGKMKAIRKDRADWYYIVRNDQGVTVATTSLSKGAKHTLSPKRVSEMARQLNLSRTQLIDLVSCTLSREEALENMEKASSS